MITANRNTKIKAEQSANDLREQVWKERGIPVDPVTIANELGIKVIEADLDDNISGAILKEKNKDAIIVLNSADSDNRKRFSCAHELGHYIYNQINEDDYDDFESVDFRNEISSKGQDPVEIFSNQFAANLLMPKENVLKLYKKGVNVVVLAVKFGVSLEAMENRINSLT